MHVSLVFIITCLSQLHLNPNRGKGGAAANVAKFLPLGMNFCNNCYFKKRCEDSKSAWNQSFVRLRKAHTKVAQEASECGIVEYSSQSILVWEGLHVYCWAPLMLGVFNMIPCVQGMAMVRGVLALGSPLACSSRLLSSLVLVQSLRECVSGHGAHERLPSPSANTCSRLSTTSASTFAFSFALQPALWQTAPRSFVNDHRTCGAPRITTEVSEFATYAAPAQDITPEDVLHFW